MLTRIRSFRMSTRSTIMLAMFSAAVIAVGPVSQLGIDLVLIGTVAAAIAAQSRTTSVLHRVTLILRVGLVGAGGRIIAQSLMSSDVPSRGGIAGGVGDMVAGGNAAVGTLVCVIALCALTVVAWRRGGVGDALLAGSALALSIAVVGALAWTQDIQLLEALQVMPFACGFAVVLALPVVTRLARRQSADLVHEPLLDVPSGT